MIAVVMSFVVSVGSSLPAQAKTKKQSASRKSKVAARNSSGKIAKSSSSKKKKQVVSRNRRGRSVNAVQPRSARNRVVKGSRARLSRSARLRRARALYLARMRAARARDAALSNIAANNIEKDQTEGEDLEIRQAVLSAMSGRSATVVVMDPNTGRIFTVVNQQMALRSPVKPCSTVKMIVGLAVFQFFTKAENNTHFMF